MNLHFIHFATYILAMRSKFSVFYFMRTYSVCFWFDCIIILCDKKYFITPCGDRVIRVVPPYPLHVVRGD